MNGFEKEVKKILTEKGWHLLRHAKGSHEYWGKEGKKSITVPHGCKSRHTANAIMKEAKIKHKF
ncbi:MAG: addiction module toxin, HicA family [Methylomarinum sp.]|nr:addiction module toxin, HicA family [Methylomarinum sp.]